MSLVYEELSNAVITAAHSIHRSVGYGLLESVYQKALEVELEYRNIPFSAQKSLKVFHRNRSVGKFYADFVVDNKIILELKSVNSFSPAMEAQLLNYLYISKLKVGYLFNFRGRRFVWRRLLL